MRDPRLPSPSVGTLAMIVAVIGGVVALMLAFVAEGSSSLAVVVGSGVILLASAIGLWRESVWGGPLFSLACVVGSVAVIPLSAVGQVAGVFGLLFALAVSWGFVRAGFRKLADSPIEPEKPEIEEKTAGSPFVSHVYVELWIGLAILGVILSIVVPLLMK